MKTKMITALTLASGVGLLATAALAENQPAAPAPVPAATVPSPAAAPEQIVYAPQLPSVAELNKAAAAQGVTIALITQSPRDVNVTFASADGRTRVVSYRLLSDAGADQAQVAAPATVYVAPAPAVYYRDYYGPVYSPGWAPYPPVSFRFGFGFRGGRRW